MTILLLLIVNEALHFLKNAYKFLYCIYKILNLKNQEDFYIAIFAEIYFLQPSSKIPSRRIFSEIIM